MATDPADDVLFEVPQGGGRPEAKVPVGRSKTFRHYDPTQSFLLPPSLDVGVHPRVMAARIGHGTVKTTMEIYARASNSADREAAALLQERFAVAFPDVERPDDLR